VLELRKNAREQKNWSASDLIRDQLNKAGIKVKDGAEGSTWEVE
jgi:cysteinyl-tRNA synthetase